MNVANDGDRRRRMFRSSAADYGVVFDAVQWERVRSI